MGGVRAEAVIRAAEPADAAELVALQAQIYREGRWFVGDGPPAEAGLARRLQGHDRGMSLYLVADGGGELWGWLELHRPQPYRLRHVATLTIAVAPSRRRHGLGRGLLQRSFQWARRVGVRKVSLHVRASNRAAIRFYEREGFELEGRERQQIRVGNGFEDNLLMARFMD